MLNITILCIGNLKEKFLRDGCLEFQKRLQAFCKLEIMELDEERLMSNHNIGDISNVIEKEGRRIIAKLPKNSCIIPLCIEGFQLTSEELAAKMETLAGIGKSHLTFIIGGSHGLSDEVKNLADLRLSLSKMTLPHQLTRLVLLEQIYRAFTINSNIKYHK